MPNHKNWPVINIIICLLIFLIGCAIECLIIYDTTVFINATFESSKSGAAPVLVIYFGLLLLAFAFLLLFSIDAAWNYNSLQVAVCAGFLVWIVIYTIIQEMQLNNFRVTSLDFASIVLKYASDSSLNVTHLKSELVTFLDTSNVLFDPFAPVGDKSLTQIAIDVNTNIGIFERIGMLTGILMGGMAVAAFADLIVAYQSFISVGWSTYSKYGANLETKRIITRINMFMIALKLNNFFLIGSTLQYVVVALYISDKQRSLVNLWVALTGTMLFVILYLASGWLTIHRGSKKWLHLFLALATLNISATLWIFLDIQARKYLFSPTIIWLTSFLVFQLCANLASFALGLWVHSNFDPIKALIQQNGPDSPPLERFTLE